MREDLGSTAWNATVMTARRWVLVVVGGVVLLMGVVFALQGDGIIGGSALMSGNPTYIYVGAGVAVLGAVVAALGLFANRA